MNIKLIVICILYTVCMFIHLILIINDMKKDIKYMKERLNDGR